MGKSENQLGTNDRWGTPRKIWAPLVAHLGPIHLDPFGNPRSTVPAAKKILLPEYWTPSNTPLLELGGYVRGDAQDPAMSFESPFTYCNGPYSKLKWWVHKALAAYTPPTGGHLVMLLPVRTSGAAWQELLNDQEALICYLNFRVKHTGAEYGAAFHQALVYKGLRPSAFEKAVAGLGTIR